MPTRVIKMGAALGLLMAFVNFGCQSMEMSPPARAPAIKPATNPTSEATTKPSTRMSLLYHRLGGEKGIRFVVDEFVTRAMANTKANFTRKGTAQEWKPTPEATERLKQHLVQYISVITGGPIKYEGKDMQAAHREMKITGEEFDALASDLAAAMKALNVGPKEQDDLMRMVSQSRDSIVEN